MNLLRSPRALLGVVLLALLGACDSPTPPSTNSTINLVPPTADPEFPEAHGFAQFERSGNDRELEVEVQDLPPGTAVSFTLHGNLLGTRTANAEGRASINLSSESGDSLPFEVTGMLLSVTTQSDGILVVSGTF